MILHYASSCKHKETVYKKCRKVGHLQKVCRSKQSKPTRKPHRTINNIQDDATNKYHYIPKKAIPWKLSDDIEGIILSMKLNTGASKSLMSERKFRVLWPERNHSPSPVSLCSYSGLYLHWGLWMSLLRTKHNAIRYH